MLTIPARSVRATGLGPPQSKYIRTRFTTDQGLPSDIVDDVVQTQDGFLWLRENGLELVRFDGQHFATTTKTEALTSLAVAPNGDLWIAARNALEFIPASNLNQLYQWQVMSYSLAPGLSIEVLHFTRHGVLWVGTNRGLYRFEHGVFSPVIFGRYITHVEESGNGHLWITTPDGPEEWDGSSAVPHPELAAQLGVKATDIFDVLEDSKDVT
jgi:ligand-binding sensor domain-containing protein